MRAPSITATVIIASTLVAPAIARASLDLGPGELVMAGGSAVTVTGYSVPGLVRWNGDTLADLVVGEGPIGGVTGKVRVYLNTGTEDEPAFDAGFTYVLSGSGDLAVPASGCQGAAPRVADWNGDGKKDLLVGQADGLVRIYLNTGTDDDPAFDAGALLRVGPAGGQVDLDVGYRAMPCVVDWNNDGRKDLAVGALDGKVHLFLNSGTDEAPFFAAESFAEDGGAALVVAAGRSAPVAMDLDHDGRKDLLTGDTEGRLYLYANIGTDAAPLFSGCVQVAADGVPIDLAGTPRSRPFVCDWNGDALADVVIGAGDGKVHLYRGVYGEAGVPPAAGVRVPEVFPNPFAGDLNVRFALDEASRVRVGIWDVGGRRLATLADRVFPVGEHALAWNGRDARGRLVAPGVYFVRISPGAGAMRVVRVR